MRIPSERSRCADANCNVGRVRISGTGRADDWPQWLGPKRDSVWRETGLLEKFPASGPEGAVAHADRRRVLRPGRRGRQSVRHGLRRSEAIAPSPGRRSAIKIDGQERVLCFNAADGKPLWKHEYDCPYFVSYEAGPRCTPTIVGGKVYTLGAMGDLHCLEATGGSVLWTKDLKKEYDIPAPLWGFSGHPLVDGQQAVRHRRRRRQRARRLRQGHRQRNLAFTVREGTGLLPAVDHRSRRHSPTHPLDAGRHQQRQS